MKRLYIALALLSSSSALAQSTSCYGGAGFFRAGYGSLHQFSQVLETFASSGQLPIGNDFVYLGGEGYARLNHYVLGGGGYAMARRSLAGSGFYAEPFSGGGYFYLGRIVLSSRRFWLYPTAGVGVAVVGLSQRQQQGTTTLESSVMLPNVNAQLGVGADWLCAAFGDQESYGGLLVGLRAGYQISPYSSGWQRTGDLLLPDYPRYATRGFFVTLAIGIGAFRKTPGLPPAH